MDKQSSPARGCYKFGELESTTSAGARRARRLVRGARGEIVGIAGVDGNGQTELIDALTGLRHIEYGRSSSGEGPPRGRARHRLDEGPRSHPEDRQRRGLVLDFLARGEPVAPRFDKPAELALRLAAPHGGFAVRAG